MKFKQVKKVGVSMIIRYCGIRSCSNDLESNHNEVQNSGTLGGVTSGVDL